MTAAAEIDERSAVLLRPPYFRVRRVSAAVVCFHARRVPSRRYVSFCPFSIRIRIASM